MSYWKNITALYNKQTAKGIAEYGQTLEQNKEMDIVTRITMAEEELIDTLMYLEHIKALLRKDD